MSSLLKSPTYSIPPLSHSFASWVTCTCILHFIYSHIYLLYHKCSLRTDIGFYSQVYPQYLERCLNNCLLKEWKANSMRLLIHHGLLPLSFLLYLFTITPDICQTLNISHITNSQKFGTGGLLNPSSLQYFNICVKEKNVKLKILPLSSSYLYNLCHTYIIYSSQELYTY